MKNLFVAILLAFCICLSFSYINPVQSQRDSPDPGVIKSQDGFYYAVTTGGWNG
jgi:hypothetical protein